jgi:hypothetical protein
MGGAAAGAARGGGAGKSAGATGGGVGSPVLDCPAYCEALCEAVVECGLDAADCRVGCAVETPELCNLLSIEPRTCQELVDEASCYTLIGEGGACSQGGLTSGLCAPGSGSFAGPCADRVCSPITNTCEPCTSDEQCASGVPGIPGNVRACQEARCLQVECLGDGDCRFDEKSELCHTETHTCTACTTDDDCNEIDATCVEGRCHACAEDDDCFGLTPMCNTESGRCEACSPSNCDMMCDTLDGCIECGDDVDCDTGEACHPFDHVCGQACEGIDACPQGFTCSLQVCVPE